jgi:hypothetical protein
MTAYILHRREREAYEFEHSALEGEQQHGDGRRKKGSKKPTPYELLMNTMH